MKHSAVGFAGLLVAVVLSGCSYTDPCAKLPPPTPQELAAVKSGASVERDVDTRIECDLVNGRWTREMD